MNKAVFVTVLGTPLASLFGPVRRLLPRGGEDLWSMAPADQQVI